jgi:hypothetical protein
VGGLNYSYIVEANTTSTPLNAGATFTGTWTLCDKYASVVVSGKTDQDSHLYVDFSPDGTNVDSTLTYKMTAGLNEAHKLAVTKNYFRIRIENTSASNQTYLRAQSMLGEQSNLSSPLNSLIQSDADALMVRTRDAEFDIAAGRMQGVEIVNKFGRNPDIDSATVPEDIWENGGAYTGFNAVAAEVCEIFSSSASDAAAGVGARTIRIIGLDADYNVQSETITLNGVTPVDSVNSYIRVHTASIQASGSSIFNVGNITVRQKVTTANIFLFMLPSTNQTNNSGYTVPAGKTAYMRKIHAAIRGGATATLDGAIWARAFGMVPRLRRPFTVSVNQDVKDVIYGGLVFTEKTDLILRITFSSANNVDSTGGYDLILVDN